MSISFRQICPLELFCYETLFELYFTVRRITLCKGAPSSKATQATSSCPRTAKTQNCKSPCGHSSGTGAMGLTDFVVSHFSKAASFGHSTQSDQRALPCLSTLTFSLPNMRTRPRIFVTCGDDSVIFHGSQKPPTTYPLKLTPVAPCECKARRRTVCGDCACQIALSLSLSVAPCESHLKARRRALCASRACRVALAAAPCQSQSSPTNPLRRLRLSNRSRCGAVPLCGDSCQTALAVAPCEFATSPTNPLRRLCLSNCCRCCGAVRIFYVADEPSAETARVGSL